MPLTIEDCTALENYTQKTNKFSLAGYKTYAKCVYVYDGDTIHVVFKSPNSNDFFKWNVRLTGIDTPEMKSKNIAEKEKAVKSKEYLANKILNKIIIVDCGGFDKYGRLLATIYPQDNENKSLNDEMIECGHAKAYDGGTKEGWDDI
jgi:endonuclease YncB( thermonuclease family)